MSELNNSLKNATGAFQLGIDRLEEADTDRKLRAADQADKVQTWSDTWRAFLTPRNLMATATALVVLGSLVTAIIQGRADTGEVLEALRQIEAIQAEAVAVDVEPAD